MTEGNGSSGHDDQPLRVHRLRFTERALAEVEAAHDRLAEYSGQDSADAWEKGLFEEIAKLATLPLRHPAPVESARFRGNVKQFVYRRSRQSAYSECLSRDIHCSGGKPGRPDCCYFHDTTWGGTAHHAGGGKGDGAGSMTATKLSKRTGILTL